MPVKKPLLGAAAEDHPAGSQELPVALEHQPSNDEMRVDWGHYR
jgi:hypothetical protein